jgi:hypothetical protein
MDIGTVLQQEPHLLFIAVTGGLEEVVLRHFIDK